MGDYFSSSIGNISITNCIFHNNKYTEDSLIGFEYENFFYESYIYHTFLMNNCSFENNFITRKNENSNYTEYCLKIAGLWNGNLLNTNFTNNNIGGIYIEATDDYS